MCKTRKYQLATIRDYDILRQITATTELQGRDAYDFHAAFVTGIDKIGKKYSEF